MNDYRRTRTLRESKFKQNTWFEGDGSIRWDLRSEKSQLPESPCHVRQKPTLASSNVSFTVVRLTSWLVAKVTRERNAAANGANRMIIVLYGQSEAGQREERQPGRERYIYIIQDTG